MLLGRYAEEPRIETAADPIWLIGTTFQPRGSHPFSVKITFPFSQAAHVTHRGKEASLNAFVSFPFPCLRHTRHVCLGTFRHTYVPLMKNPVIMAEGLEIPIWISGVPLRRYRIYPVRETRNFDREILSTSLTQRRKWGSRWYFTWLSIWRIRNWSSFRIGLSQSLPLLSSSELPKIIREGNGITFGNLLTRYRGKWIFKSLILYKTPGN